MLMNRFKENEMINTLNGSSLAVGSITIPEILKPYLGM